MKLDKEYLLKKWLADDLTEEELKVFMQLDDYDEHTKAVDTSKAFKSSEILEVASLDSFFAKVKSRKNKVVRRTSWLEPIFNVAAVCAIIIGVTSIFYLSRSTSVETTTGEKQNVDFPDGSAVTLNSESSIKYQPGKWEAERKVELEGEAYFKVEKGRRFDVITSEGTITVLGTEFNVKDREGFFAVTCYKGLVTLKNGNIDQNIPAGSTFEMVKDKTVFIENYDNSPDWFQNLSTFESVAFADVLKEFERHYEVVFLTDNIDVSRVFTGGFVHHNLEDGLKSITLPLDLTYSIDKKGTITLRKFKK